MTESQMARQQETLRSVSGPWGATGTKEYGLLWTGSATYKKGMGS